MAEPLDPLAYASFLVLFRTLQRLVMRGVLSQDDAREIADGALLDAQQMIGHRPDAKAALDILEGLLKDLDAQPKR